MKKHLEFFIYLVIFLIYCSTMGCAGRAPQQKKVAKPIVEQTTETMKSIQVVSVGHYSFEGKMTQEQFAKKLTELPLFTDSSKVQAIIIDGIPDTIGEKIDWKIELVLEYDTTKTNNKDRGTKTITKKIGAS